MNQISRLEGLTSQSQLERLVLYGNQIARIEGLGSLTRLKELQINRNKLTDSLHYLADVPNIGSTLETLNASHNLIPETEIENVCSLIGELGNLKTLELYGNPLAQKDSYKYRVCGSSASLERLDGLNMKAGSFLRQRLDQLKTEWETTRLVESTH